MTGPVSLATVLSRVLISAGSDCAFAADSECAVEVGACVGEGSRAISGSDTTTDSISTTGTTTPGVIGGSNSYTEHTFTTYTTPGLFSDSGTTTSMTSTGCPTEELACVEDSACAECYQSMWDSWVPCESSLVTSGDGCDRLEDRACCAIDGCEDNELLVAYFGAFLVLPQCPGIPGGGGISRLGQGIRWGRSFSVWT